MGLRQLVVVVVPQWCCELDAESDPGNLPVPRIVAPSGSTQSHIFGYRLPPGWRKEAAMQVVYERCCGLDVHNS